MPKCNHHWIMPIGDGKCTSVLATCKLCGKHKPMITSVKRAYRIAGLPTDSQCRREAREAGYPRS